MTFDLPERASDAGPVSQADCPKCGLRKWHTLCDCAACGGPVCDLCPGTVMYADALVCGECLKGDNVKAPLVDMNWEEIT